LRKTVLLFARPKAILVLAVVTLMIFGGAAFGLVAVTQDALETPNGLKSRKFVVDPGHGGIDGGTNSQDFLEKEVNLEVAKKLQSELMERGAKVVLTREEDLSPGNTGPDGKGYNYRRSLATRVDIIEKNKPDVFLSIHVNASNRRPATSGAIVYYNKAVPNAGLLAETVQKYLNMVTKKNGFKEHKTQATNFYILRNTARPGAVVEIGFMTNPQEKAMLKQETYQWELARAMADALAEYMSNENL